MRDLIAAAALSLVGEEASVRSPQLFVESLGASSQSLLDRYEALSASEQFVVRSGAAVLLRESLGTPAENVSFHVEFESPAHRKRFVTESLGTLVSSFGVTSSAVSGAVEKITGAIDQKTLDQVLSESGVGSFSIAPAKRRVSTRDTYAVSISCPLDHQAGLIRDRLFESRISSEQIEAVLVPGGASNADHVVVHFDAKKLNPSTARIVLEAKTSAWLDANQSSDALVEAVYQDQVGRNQTAESILVYASEGDALLSASAAAAQGVPSSVIGKYVLAESAFDSPKAPVDSISPAYWGALSQVGFEDRALFERIRQSSITADTVSRFGEVFASGNLVESISEMEASGEQLPPMSDVESSFLRDYMTSSVQTSALSCISVQGDEDKLTELGVRLSESGLVESYHQEGDRLSLVTLFPSVTAPVVSAQRGLKVSSSAKDRRFAEGSLALIESARGASNLSEMALAGVFSEVLERAKSGRLSEVTAAAALDDLQSGTGDFVGSDGEVLDGNLVKAALAQLMAQISSELMSQTGGTTAIEITPPEPSSEEEEEVADADFEDDFSDEDFGDDVGGGSPPMGAADAGGGGDEDVFVDDEEFFGDEEEGAEEEAVDFPDEEEFGESLERYLSGKTLPKIVERTLRGVSPQDAQKRLARLCVSGWINEATWQDFNEATGFSPVLPSLGRLRSLVESCKVRMVRERALRLLSLPGFIDSLSKSKTRLGLQESANRVLARRVPETANSERLTKSAVKLISESLGKVDALKVQRTTEYEIAFDVDRDSVPAFVSEIKALAESSGIEVSSITKPSKIKGYRRVVVDSDSKLEPVARFVEQRITSQDRSLRGDPLRGATVVLSEAYADGDSVIPDGVEGRLVSRRNGTAVVRIAGKSLSVPARSLVVTEARRAGGRLTERVSSTGGVPLSNIPVREMGSRVIECFTTSVDGLVSSVTESVGGSVVSSSGSSVRFAFGSVEEANQAAAVAESYGSFPYSVAVLDSYIDSRGNHSGKVLRESVGLLESLCSHLDAQKKILASHLSRVLAEDSGEFGGESSIIGKLTAAGALLSGVAAAISEAAVEEHSATASIVESSTVLTESSAPSFGEGFRGEALVEEIIRLEDQSVGDSLMEHVTGEITFGQLSERLLSSVHPLMGEVSTDEYNREIKNLIQNAHRLKEATNAAR